MTGTLAAPFPLPTPELEQAYNDLFLAANGDEDTKRQIGNPALLPRPWDPPTCTRPALRRELWAWLEAVVTWFNHEYVWDFNGGVIPACWPQHPHLVHEIAVLADQRRRAGVDTTSGSLEEWHRYCVPAFLDRLRSRTKNACDERHAAWPAKGRFARYTDPASLAARAKLFDDDVATIPDGPDDPDRPPRPSSRPKLRLIDADGGTIDPATGEVF